MVMSAAVFETEIVRLDNVSQELTVGVGCATATVRTLTNVSLAVCTRELLVLTGSRGAGERALLAVLAGDRRGVSGSCAVHSATRIRFVNIHASAALALAQEWAHAATLAPPDPYTSDVLKRQLFLLNIVDPRATGVNATIMPPSPSAWCESNRLVLRDWVARYRRRGGAVVMAAGEALGASLFTKAINHLRAAPTTRPHTLLAAAVREGHSAAAPSAVRVIVMHAGRLAPPVRLEWNDLSFTS